MDKSTSVITKEQVMPFFEKWDALKPEIQQLYDEKHSGAAELMRSAIADYEQLLEVCAPAGGSDRRTKMEPLNGEERLQFIKDKVISPFALIQLSLLYMELRKKIARFIGT
ncbi:YpoC family protein [Sporosarcina gallistercoris]|uniref:YpoC family protein n=1 Tax=Sporosarcina gallistercoris TaxID=2762245 RepID=UPI003D2D699F